MNCISTPLYVGILIAALSGATAASSAPAVNAIDYEGSVGKEHVGMTLVVKDGKIAAGSHYFYRRYLTDIPLSGQLGKEIVLSEAGGGQFVLRFVSRANAPEPLNFDNTVALDGVWKSAKGGPLPVSLTLRGATPGQDDHLGVARYHEVTQQSDTVFESGVQEFYRAVLAGDHARAESHMRFPVKVNFASGKHLVLKNAKAMDKEWEHIFNKGWRESATKATPHDLAVISGMAMLGDGLAFFGPKGVEVINTGP